MKIGEKGINANKFEAGKTITGKIYFEEDGYVYKAQSVNGVLNMGKVKYTEIKEVGKSNTLGIIPNGLTIKLKNGTVEKYALTTRNEVISYLSNKISTEEVK